MRAQRIVFAMDVVHCRRCGHNLSTHKHYRAGKDCSACECPRFQQRGSGLRAELYRLTARLLNA